MSNGMVTVTEMELLAQRVVDRVLAVYSPQYIRECAEKEPDSLLGLVTRLERSLKRSLSLTTLMQIILKDNNGQTIETLTTDKRALADLVIFQKRYFLLPRRVAVGRPIPDVVIYYESVKHWEMECSEEKKAG